MTSEAETGEAGPSRVRDLPTWLIGRAHARSHRLLGAGFARAETRGHHYRLLAALEEFGAASQATLGRRTDIDRSDVVAALNELAAAGLIERASDPEDRRRNVITITPAGLDLLGELDKVVAGVQEDVLAPLSAAERKEFLRLLARLLEPTDR